ncbi:chlorophyll synthase ChlG [Qipengyuania sp. G39]|uniref:Chlorophyll synthase ChlG n=1 Tax=Qipengyuania profundimaris TaxID=3067652 RepID=A0ABT9HP92_9SPHN|nr:chlorophyll synthase ChlG [Qipengyuania sp. G39]MDP4574963.1 chlorophyll synthase ChlG [Qipengyuania sp. G39]
MLRSAASNRTVPVPSASAVVELLKPITWFPPMWAFGCGVVSSGAAFDQRWLFVAGGIALAGPFVCGTSQAVNDWFDRHVDAINEPDRPIPSGRVAGRWGLGIAIAGTVLSLALAAIIGFWVFAAAVVGLALAWAYSAPPFRLKTSGWAGPAAVGLTYEGLSWFTGASVMVGGLPSPEVVTILLLYSTGAFGIMVLNDFKAVEGDRVTGLGSLPVTLGIARAARLACLFMAGAQAVVIALLLAWSYALSAAIVAALLLGQVALMTRLLKDPARFAPWYNATGVTLFVLGMLASALGLGGYI